MAMGSYGPGVRIGNWNEDICLEEEQMKDFLEKRDKGELLIQKSRKLKENLLKKVELSVSKDGCVHFGDTVMLVNTEPLNKGPNHFVQGHLTLSINPDEMKAYISDKLEAPCGVSGSKNVSPIGRNTFTLLSPDGGALGEPIRYGQSFCLGTTGGFPDQMLYLASDHKTFLSASKLSRLQEAFLTDKISYLAYWQAAFLDPQLRLEYEGFPIQANTKILIYHCHTNRGLAVHRKHRLRTYFGGECEVASHTHLDSHRVEKEQNHWILITGNPSGDSPSMLERATPPSEETKGLAGAQSTMPLSPTPFPSQFAGN
ncbi:cilia- and flagella-associated protein 161 isoform X1 [Tachyglossus aculeatus]|uniref:cilia- and flagella-associated protein 161 isoform X1 n=1 Tax=Tachyglossus aculeatus TaxID=9261 RepID=UPI0018F7B057|nr:cilia- and flagella-associated protein 161 isoform X1 [Tachyglossus aculeatus]